LRKLRRMIDLRKIKGKYTPKLNDRPDKNTLGNFLIIT
jgi:hypothetical protein